MTRKPRSHVRFLIYRTWAIVLYVDHLIARHLLIVFCLVAGYKTVYARLFLLNGVVINSYETRRIKNF